MNCSFNIRYKPRTTRAYTKTDLTVYDSAGNTALNALTVYGKSEVVDGSIKSAGEGYAVVDLGTLTWTLSGSGEERKFYAELPTKIVNNTNKLFCSKYPFYGNTFTGMPNLSMAGNRVYSYIYIRDDSYTDATAFKNSLNGVLLCYELADPTQGNAIAIKTDNGSGIDGTMAVFETGTPLYGVSDTVRDVMMWDGSVGTVTKNCGEVDLGTQNWSTYQGCFYTSIPSIEQGASPIIRRKILCSKYIVSPIIPPSWTEMLDKTILKNNSDSIFIKDTDYETPADFKTAMSGVTLIYTLETPTTQALTSTENASIAGLRMFAPQTHAQNNAQTEMTVDYTIRVPTI